MATKRLLLLALLNELHVCEESLSDSDIGVIHADPDQPGFVLHQLTPEDIEREVDPSTIRFKDDPWWAELHQATKLELANREHVPGGRERETKRQKRAAEQRTYELRAGKARFQKSPQGKDS